MIRAAALAAALLLPACAQMPWEDGPAGASVSRAVEAASPSGPARLDAQIIGADGSAIGDLVLRQGPHGVMVEATVRAGGLAPGWHGLHLHQVGDCSDVGAFKRSGGHVGMIEGGHGLLNPLGPEAGDLPNIWAGPDGSAGYEAFTALTSTGALSDADGTALIIHESRDDHLSQPIGGAGARVACAVVAGPK